jgi:D-serine deaminase-like pyridoxal phosphate-dependent protein
VDQAVVSRSRVDQSDFHSQEVAAPALAGEDRADDKSLHDSRLHRQSAPRYCRLATSVATQHLRGWDEWRQAIAQAIDKAGRNQDRDGAPTKAFEPSLFVWATVMSRPTEDRAIVDAGLKALAFDSGPPLVCDEPAATYERASDEHGRLAVSAATNRLGLGDKIRLIPGHCDPTVNLYDWYVCVRGNRVEQLWPITARGAVY